MIYTNNVSARHEALLLDGELAKIDMDTKENIEQLKFIIDRFDHYYESVNNKGNVYLALNTFGLAGLIAAYVHIFPKGPSCFSGFDFLFIFCLVLNLLSIVFVLLALKPFLLAKKFGKKKSLIYFGDVSLYDEESLESAWDALDSKAYCKDLLRQSHVLANGLKEKYNRLFWATWFMIGQIALVFLMALTFVF